MTGRDIFEKITYSEVFRSDMLVFSANGNLEVERPDYSPLEFLTLYCTLVSSSELLKYDPDKLLENYLFIESRLKENGQIRSNEFLSRPLENMTYIPQNNRCIMQR